jgi:hypothetical protein
MKKTIFFITTVAMLMSYISMGQKAKTDTIQGIVVYTAHSNIRFISQGDYHTYTVAATEIKTDTGVISIRTEDGYLDLKKNYSFVPIDKLQPAKLKSRP